VTGVRAGKLLARGSTAAGGGGRGGSGKTMREALCWVISELGRLTGV
jgi:hypothetical protein